MKATLLFTLALGLSGCFTSDNTCPLSPSKILDSYNEIHKIDDKLKERVAIFDQGLDKDLSEDENYLKILELKSQRDQLVLDLRSFRQGHNNCLFQGSQYNNLKINEELNQLE